MNKNDIIGNEHPILAELQKALCSDDSHRIRGAILAGSLLSAIELLVTDGSKNPYDDDAFIQIIDEVWKSANELETEMNQGTSH